MNKSTKNVAIAFENILLKSNGRKPICLQTDKGKEFTGQELQEFLKKKEISYRIARSPVTKAAVAERLVRTVKERIWRFFSHGNTRRYVDILQSVIDAYNHSKHSATKIVPRAC